MQAEPKKMFDKPRVSQLRNEQRQFVSESTPSSNKYKFEAEVKDIISKAFGDANKCSVKDEK